MITVSRWKHYVFATYRYGTVVIEYSGLTEHEAVSRLAEGLKKQGITLEG
jgi:hypothetical protein